MQTNKLFVPRIILVLGLTLALSAVLPAAPIAGLAPCATTTTYGSIGVGCQVGDKQFTNFNVGAAGTIPSDWAMTFEILTGGVYRLDFAQGTSGSLLQYPAGPWTVSYNVQVDTNMSPNSHITQVGVALNPGAFGDGNVRKTVTDLTPGNEGFILGVGIADTLSAGSNPSNFPLTPSSQWIRVVEVVTLTGPGSALSSFTDGFKQEAVVPEPATYGMIGLGLAALGLVSRRKRT